MMNRSTWDLVSECRLRKCRKLSAAAGFALLGSVLGRAVVAPLTWAVVSLLQGEAYVCALSEFVDPVTLDGFPSDRGPDDTATFPCVQSVPDELSRYVPEITRRLKYESQLVGWLLVAGMSTAVFLLLCLKRCSSPLGYQQEDYWSRYRSNERSLFQSTASVHARLLAARNVKRFFGFVALDAGEKEELDRHRDAAAPVHSTDWNRVTGVYLYREKDGVPLYSRLNKWATYSLEDDMEAMEKEMDVLS